MAELRVLGGGGDEDPDFHIGCRCCHADGALSDATLDHVLREAKLNAAAERRDLYYTVHKPSRLEAGASDERCLAVELRRPLLPEDDDQSELAELLREALKENAPKQCESGDEARAVLKRLMDDKSEGSLGALFRRDPALAHALDKLDALVAAPAPAESKEAQEGRGVPRHCPGPARGRRR